MEYKQVITRMAYKPVNDPHASQIKHIQHSPFLTAWPLVNFPPCTCHSQPKPLHAFRILSWKEFLLYRSKLFSLPDFHFTTITLAPSILSNHTVLFLYAWFGLLHCNYSPRQLFPNRLIPTIGNATFKPNNSSNHFTYIIPYALLVAAISSASLMDNATVFGMCSAE